MNIQNIIVGIIVLLACIYIGRIVWQKVESFSSKSSCGNDCGCGDAKSAAKNSLINTQKS